MTSRTDADSCNQEGDDSCYKAAAAAAATVAGDAEGDERGGGHGGDSSSSERGEASTELTSIDERKYECQREYKVCLKDCSVVYDCVFLISLYFIHPMAFL